MTFNPIVVKRLEVDGYTVVVHAATYRQLLRASEAQPPMAGTADLCDLTCEIVGHDEPASELLTVPAVNRLVHIAIEFADPDGKDDTAGGQRKLPF